MSQFFINGNTPGTTDIITITGNSGGAAGPDSSGNFNIIGSGSVTVVTNAATHTATISVSGSGIGWTDESVSFQSVVSNGYFCTAALTATLPASPSQGDVVAFNTVTGGNVFIQANTGQTIVLGSGSSSVAGTAKASVTGNSITLVYRSTGATWRSISSLGSWTLS